MTFAMSLLARNPEWQEKLHAEVSQANILPLDKVESEGESESESKSVDDSTPLRFLPYEEMSNLPLVLAAAVETLRMRDMAMQLTRVASRDTTLNYRTWEGDADADANAAETKIQEHTVVIPAGTRVHLDMAAFGVNPFKWKDPEIYNPTRHLRQTDDVNGEKMTVRFFLFFLFSCLPLLLFTDKDSEAGTNAPRRSRSRTFSASRPARVNALASALPR